MDMLPLFTIRLFPELPRLPMLTGASLLWIMTSLPLILKVFTDPVPDTEKSRDCIVTAQSATAYTSPIEILCAARLPPPVMTPAPSSVNLPSPLTDPSRFSRVPSIIWREERSCPLFVTRLGVDGMEISAPLSNVREELSASVREEYTSLYS